MRHLPKVTEKCASDKAPSVPELDDGLIEFLYASKTLLVYTLITKYTRGGSKDLRLQLLSGEYLLAPNPLTSVTPKGDRRTVTQPIAPPIPQQKRRPRRH
eukprot:13214-Prorocentrum_minimum.AAC.3